jgi:RNA polymerase sigma-70 factor (ECF subfamily)
MVVWDVGCDSATRRRVKCVWPGWSRALVWLFALAEAGASATSGDNARNPYEATPNVIPSGVTPPTTPGSASYEEFVRAHERAILNYLWRLTGDEQSAYDLTQETFLRAWTHFDQVRGYENPRGWLFHVATNLGLTAVTRGKRVASHPLDDDRGAGPEVSDPARRLVERDLVRATLLRLNPQRRAALVLREVYGLNGLELAKALGTTEVAARMTLSRAREQFRELYLREECGEEHSHDA